LFLLIDLAILNGVIYYVSDEDFLNTNFLLYISVFWVISALFSGYYKVYRFTKIFRVLTLLLQQFLLFSLGYFAYFTIFKEGVVVNNQAYILGLIFIGITLFKFTSFFALKKYRSKGLNYRKVVIVGHDDSSEKTKKIIQNQKELGYQYVGFFSDNPSDKNKQDFLGKLNKSEVYILKNEIDEVYCTLSQLDKNQIKDFTKFANVHDRVLKLIPNAHELYSKKMATEFYDDTLLLLNVRKLPFEYSENRIIKRVFDITFSSFVIVFVLSWLTPIIWVLIKLESKGPVLFKQKREGLNGQQFVCYKFRSMRINNLSDKKHATKNDVRVTKIGAFLRKTSLDELPQFLNVLKGDMSVVGPRPHLKSFSLEYQKDVDNYLERHAVKPGITGLAQVSGYRGEVKKISDIKNRVRFDIFYIENWSFLLDIKIIIQTVLNVFQGEEKAY